MLTSIVMIIIIFYLFQDKLLTKLEENEPELASSQEDEDIKGLIEHFDIVRKTCDRPEKLQLPNELVVQWVAKLD
uniref:Uncharacterized protein n=1 Tax=Vespula pensylvanica TaxID=30213 RepID=A0A834UG33_VESPE|nr:hypothetical protein H0235_000712 [Vespula pensylvanica]